MILFAENYCKSTWYLKNWLPYNLERIRLQLEKLRTQLRQQANWVNPSEISDSKLQKIVNGLYRPNAKIGSGSTADAVRVELYASKQVPGNALKPNVQRLTNMKEDYLGKDFKMIKNDHGDAIFINKDNTKKIRFDVLDSHGDLPHGHVQYFDGKRWRDYTDVHRIALKDSLELIKNNRPKFEG